MKIQFELRVWRNFYDQIKILGQYLKDSQPDWEGNSGKFKITLDERQKVEKEISELMRESDKYLDRTNMRPKPPQWKYNAKNEATWISSDKFAFSHLLPIGKYTLMKI